MGLQWRINVKMIIHNCKNDEDDGKDGDEKHEDDDDDNNSYIMSAERLQRNRFKHKITKYPLSPDGSKFLARASWAERTWAGA